MALTKIDDRGLKTPIDLLDNEKIRLGTGNDLELYHNGTDTHLDNDTGELALRSDRIRLRGKTGNETLAFFEEDAACELYYDNVKRFETHSEGTYHYGHSTFIIGDEGESAQLFLHADDGDDNADKWKLVASAGGPFYLQNYTSGSWESNLIAYGNGAVELYHNNSKKLETTSSGTTTTGDGYLTGRLLVGTTTAGESNGDEATFYNSGNAGITIRSGVDDECKIYFSEGTSGGSQYRGTITYDHDTNYMSFATNENERMRIDSSGNVGVGTSPSKKLHVYDSGVAYLRLETGAANGQAWDFLSTYGGSANTGTLSIRNESGSSFLDLQENGGSPRTLIANGGSVQFQFDADGIKFNGDTAAANALDDYEEGTWTPVVVGGIDGGAQYVANRGWYTKIGRFVQVSFYLHLVNNSTGSTGNGNHAVLDGLPFDTANLSPSYNSGGMVTYTSMSMAGGHTQISIYVDNSDDRMWLYRERDEVASWTTGANDNKNKSMYGYITYFTDT